MCVWRLFSWKLQLYSFPCVFLCLQPKQIGDDFCGLVLNQPLGSLRVIEGTPLFDDRTDGMASVAAYTYGEHSVVFVGTRSGHLKKVGSVLCFPPSVCLSGQPV